MLRKLVVPLLLCCVPFVAQAQQDFSKVEIKTTKIAGSVYMLEGSGGNIVYQSAPTEF